MSCNQCGMCCKAIILNVSMDDVKRMAETPKSDAMFISKNWKEITKEEALLINPHLQNWIDRPNIAPPYFYMCELLGSDNKCTVHDGGQPGTCTGFPWYGHGPIENFLLYSKDCGFKGDYANMIKECPDTIIERGGEKYEPETDRSTKTER